MGGSACLAGTSAAGQAYPCGSNLLFVRFDPQPKSAAARSRNSNKKWPRSPGTGGVWWGQELPKDLSCYMSQAALIEAWLSHVSSARVPASMACCWLVQVQWGPLRCRLLCRPQVPAFRGGPQRPPTSRENSPPLVQDPPPTMNKEEMRACFKGLGDTMAAAIGAALTANQEQMNKALKAAINARHEKSRPDIILPAQYLQLDPNKIAVHTGKDARTTFLYSMSQLNSRMLLELGCIPRPLVHRG